MNIVLVKIRNVRTKSCYVSVDFKLKIKIIRLLGIKLTKIGVLKYLCTSFSKFLIHKKKFEGRFNKRETSKNNVQDVLLFCLFEQDWD